MTKRILVLDGAMGTMIQRERLTEGRFPRRALQGPPARAQGRQRPAGHHPAERDQRDSPEYLEAGSDIIETNTFNSTSIVQADYGLESLAYELNVAGARLARQAATSGRRVRPSSRDWSPAPWVRRTGSCRFRPTSTTRRFGRRRSTRCAEAYEEQVRGLIDGGATFCSSRRCRHAQCQGRLSSRFRKSSNDVARPAPGCP